MPGQTTQNILCHISCLYYHSNSQCLAIDYSFPGQACSQKPEQIQPGQPCKHPNLRELQESPLTSSSPSPYFEIMGIDDWE